MKRVTSDVLYRWRELVHDLQGARLFDREHAALVLEQLESEVFEAYLDELQSETLGKENAA